MTEINFIRTAPISDTDNKKKATTTNTYRTFAMTLGSSGTALDQTYAVKAPAADTWDSLTAGTAVNGAGWIKFWDPNTSKFYRIATFESVWDR